MPYIFLSAIRLTDSDPSPSVYDKDMDNELISELQPTNPHDDPLRGFRVNLTVCEIFYILDRKGYQVVGQTTRQDDEGNGEETLWTLWKPFQKEEAPINKKEDESKINEKKKDDENGKAIDATSQTEMDNANWDEFAVIGDKTEQDIRQSPTTNSDEFYIVGGNAPEAYFPNGVIPSEIINMCLED